MDFANFGFWIICILVIIILCIIVVAQFRKTLAQNYSRLDSIPSKVYTSKHGDIEYLLRDEGPTILISHGITGGHLILGHEKEIKSQIRKFINNNKVTIND